MSLTYEPASTVRPGPKAGAKAKPRTKTPGSRRAESVFITAYLTVLIAIIFIGFSPSFYLRGVVEPAAPLAPLRIETIVHAALASVFMIAFPLQGFLAARRRMKAHIRIGRWAFVLGAVLVPIGYVAGAGAYHAVRPVPVPREMMEAFVSLPLFGSAALALALWLGWRSRLDGATHKRLIVTLACMMADPAIFRLPIWTMGPEGLVFIQAVMLATLAPLWIWDLATLRRIHKGTLIGSAVFAGEVVLRTLIMPTEGWTALVHALPLYGAP
ncbi:MAG: hypothetical protein QM698_09455 [Micropepsaceae bacterium]